MSSTKNQELETLCVRMPVGTKFRLEKYRRENGFRSWAEAARELMSRALIEVGF
jgi:hypothetical protein